MRQIIWMISGILLISLTSCETGPVIEEQQTPLLDTVPLYPSWITWEPVEAGQVFTPAVDSVVLSRAEADALRDYLIDVRAYIKTAEKNVDGVELEDGDLRAVIEIPSE